MTLTDKAAAFLEMHRPGSPVVLPTVWDAWSAKLAVDIGFTALTIGSHPVAEALGASDNEGLTLDRMLAQVAVITAAVDVPVSADLESGYGETAARIATGLLDAGAVGLNLEDSVHGEGGRLRSQEEHADFIAAVRAAADAAGVHAVINARTDVLVRPDIPDDDRYQLAIARLRACAAAGADVLYPVGLPGPENLRLLADSLPLPINAVARPYREKLADLAAAGVGRISFGPFWQRRLGQLSGELLAGWL
ncbi:MAG: isocitrate lyase/phosphoenolpyruvate mutase family protein [Acidimicrobiia bacterium]|nr:isocitrate lyase/phosphoenolpyruvate mutase family protein [Acidimicrobiia bacterium]